MDNDAIVKSDSGLSNESMHNVPKFARQLETRFQLAVPIDEIVILTMFIIESKRNKIVYDLSCSTSCMVKVLPSPWLINQDAD